MMLDEARGLYGAYPLLLVVDTLSRYFGDGANENSADDMNAFVASLDVLKQRRPDLHIHVIHHSGKDTERGMRGSSALKGAADTVIQCTKVVGARDRFVALVEKQKDGEDGIKLPFRLKQVLVGSNEDGTPLTSCVVESDDGGAPLGQALTDPQAIAVAILAELAQANPLMTSNRVDYATYRNGFYAKHGGDHGQDVRKAASRAIMDLRDRYGAVAWDGTEEPIVILDVLWTLVPSAKGR